MEVEQADILSYNDDISSSGLQVQVKQAGMSYNVDMSSSGLDVQVEQVGILSNWTSAMISNKLATFPSY